MGSVVLPLAIATWGHGHVFPRKDRQRTPCGHRLGYCRQCACHELHLEWMNSRSGGWPQNWHKMEPDISIYKQILDVPQ